MKTPSEFRRRKERVEALLASAESKCRRARGGRSRSGLRAAREPQRRPPEPAPREVIAIGASTGGPPVLVELLRGLTPAFAVPVVVCQHMLADHLASFAALLTRQTGRTVVPAEEGQPLEAGRTYLAPRDRHLVVRRSSSGLVAGLVDGPPEHGCKPAVDPLFRSVAEACGSTALAVVCTGMGSDGAAGAVALRARGAHVVVQDRATSVVWGMPGAVAAAGAADVQAPAHTLAGWILRLTANRPNITATPVAPGGPS